MPKKIFGLDTQPGIQRDGTVTDRNFYTDGQWVRFQRARPRKILGFREITAGLAGPSRGVYLDPENQFANIFSGYASGIQKVQIDSIGNGSGVLNFTLSGFIKSDNNLWQFDDLYDSVGGVGTLLAHPGQNLTDINSAVNTKVLGGNDNGTTLSPIGVFTATGSTNSTNVITLASANILVGAGQTVTGTNIPAGTTVVSIVGGITVTLSQAATGTSASVTFTFDNNVSVSGGVVVLHPYTFVYGNKGLIKNCSAGNTNDWVSPDANETNVSGTKVVKGLPVRGGSNSPSGLFWTLDSLVRVSYNPTTVTIGGSASTFYWRYDIISSQSSILSSQAVIEYDGIYYWCGVDRFLMYNGVVKEVPNPMNQNYFFDNLNYSQRQKVYATKVPRFGEIWWFFPRNGSDECNDVIIYNVRENTWYDAGQAIGARRSAGYFSQVFPFPINIDWDANQTNAIITLEIKDAGTGYTDGVYANVPFDGGNGTNAFAIITVSGGVVTNVDLQYGGDDYLLGDELEAPTLAGGTGFAVLVTSVSNIVSMYQHEIGVNAVIRGNNIALPSYFETNNIGWTSGGPAAQSLMGDNYWLRIERIEPDFIMSGEMQLYITGRPYAQADDKVTGPYTFDQNTHKIDMREQRREPRLKFVSNTLGGDYQLGYVMALCDVGDVRGY